MTRPMWRHVRRRALERVKPTTIYPELRKLAVATVAVSITADACVAASVISLTHSGAERVAPSIADSSIGREGYTWVWIALLAIGAALGLVGTFRSWIWIELYGCMFSACGLLVWAVAALGADRDAYGYALMCATFLYVFRAINLRARDLLSDLPPRIPDPPPPLDELINGDHPAGEGVWTPDS